MRLVGSGVIVSTGFTTSASPCTDNLTPAPPSCPAGSYGPFTPDARAFETIIDFSQAGGLAPGASYGLQFDMRAPVDLANPSTTPIAWNSFAHSDFLSVPGGDDTILGPTEPIKAGIAIPYGQVRVSKAEVDPPPGITLPPYLVSFECAVQGQVVADGAEVEVAGGSSFLLPLVPVGATCRIWEVFTNGAVPDTDPDNVRVITVVDGTTAEAPQDVVLTNTYPQGSLQITKLVEGEGVGSPLVPDGAWGDGPFTVNVDCQFPASGGASLIDFPRDIDLVAGQTVTIERLPVGAACTITETDDGGASDSTMRLDRVGAPRTNPTSTTVIISDSDPSTVEIDPNGVEVVNSFLLTQLRIVKTISGDGAPLATEDFVFSIECVQLGRVFPPITATIDRPGQTEVLVDGLPVGALCSVIEIDDGGADTDTPRLVGVVLTTLPGTGDPLVVNADNPFTGGRLALNKVVDGPGAAAATGFEFQLLVTCERPVAGGTFAPFLSETVTVTAAQPVVLDDLIPIGSRCWAQETDTAGATAVAIDYDSAATAVVVTLEQPMISITATNTYDIGDLVINKVVQGPGAASATRPFMFSVACTLGGNVQPPVSVTITPPATSVTVPGLSTGAECTVTETDAGGADAPAAIDPTTVVIGATGQPAVSVTATNDFGSGRVRLAKVLDGPFGNDATDLTFTLEVVCERPTASGFVEVLRESVLVTVAAPVELTTPLPIGTRCWATETNSNGASVSSVDFSGPGNAAIVTVESPTITITARNTFDTDVSPNVVDPPVLPATGGSLTGPATSLAALLFAVGGFLLALARRPRTG